MQFAPSAIAAARALETQAAFRTWPELGVVAVRGDDRVSWLNGQITNDVRRLTDPAAGLGVHALAINVRGKIMAEVWALVGDAERLLLVVPKAVQSALLESLERFIIMEDVVLEPQPELGLLSVEGPLSAAALTELPSAGVVHFAFDPLGLGGFACVGDQAALSALAQALRQRVPEVSADVYELVRLRRHKPKLGIDYDEHHYPQEAGLKALVSFQKGCYLGQEVVCTLENRGKLSKHLCALRTDSAALPAPGTQLYLAAADSGEAAGSITSAIWDPEQGVGHVLGYVRRVHAQPGRTLYAGSQPLTLGKLVGEDDVAPASA